MIVTGVILVIMPAIQGTHEQARRANGLSNMTQIGLSTYLYSGDFHETYPFVAARTIRMIIFISCFRRIRLRPNRLFAPLMPPGPAKKVSGEMRFRQSVVENQPPILRKLPLMCPTFVAMRMLRVLVKRVRRIRRPAMRDGLQYVVVTLSHAEGFLRFL